ncbi:MAG: nicotinamide mononucleotide transporter [Clostridia bacterium]|nr:nicotinamide mononucleotide transporter [Clostridia bacterium]
MRRIGNLFRELTIFERILWITSLIVVTISFLCVPKKDYLTLVCSLIGVTALIFVAKGYVIGQILCIVFAVFYGIISFHFKYYGEMITYLGMSAPMAVAATISWIRHPYKESKSVKVHKMKVYQIALMIVLTVVVTIAFYFILWALGTGNLIFSTLSVATSFLAVYMTFMRSPYYAIGYSANDIVLIILWVMASIENPSYIPMILCFVMFLANDIYGFISWKKMERAQAPKNDKIC